MHFFSKIEEYEKVKMACDMIIQLWIADTAIQINIYNLIKYIT